MTAAATRHGSRLARLLFLVLGLGVLAVMVAHFAASGDPGLDPARIDWRWIGVALVAQAIAFVLYAAMYRQGFGVVGVSSRTLQLVPVMFASIFAKTAVPLTAAPAAAVFIDDATSRGQSGSRTAVGLLLVTAIDLITALPFVAAGALVLVLNGRLVEFAVIGTGLFAAIIAVIVGVLVLGALRPGLLRATLGGVRSAVNLAARLVRRPEALSSDWAAHHADQLASAARSVPGDPRGIAMASSYGIVLHVVSLASLGALFLAFGQRLDPGAVAAGFGMSIVFFVVSLVPDGVGAVEGGMALVFASLGMSPAAAILVTLAYRILNVWLPVLVGFWFARRLRLFGAGLSARATESGPGRLSAEALPAPVPVPVPVEVGPAR